MAVTLTALRDLQALGFDDIIDVRSPAEYAEDHLPGAISLPVLDDDERARVGTIYKQDSPFTRPQAGRGAGGAQCGAASGRGRWPTSRAAGGRWSIAGAAGSGRGRSRSILAQIGWRVETLAGGYKTWRALVVKALYDTPVPAPVVVLDGNTGIGQDRGAGAAGGARACR